jgi:hypothetical protein
MAATPEWTGPCPGTLAFHAGPGQLLVSPDSPNPDLDGLMGRLLDELRAAAQALSGEAGLRTTVLAAGLELVAGRPVAAARGTPGDVIELALAAIRARTRGLAVQVLGPLPAAAVPAPGAIAMAVAQLAVNAQQHEGAGRVVLRVAAGPTFSVEWPSDRAVGGRVRSHRHPLRRDRWGWGYVQMVADALGAAALPPGSAGPGTDVACLGLGSAGLTLPVACVRDNRVERSTHSWDQDPGVPGFDQPAVTGLLARLVAAAAGRPGRIAYGDLYRARLVRDRTWVALAPHSGTSRALDLLRGLQHERALWSAPEPHATRVAALATLLRVALGEPWPSVPPRAYAEDLARACASLGVDLPEPLDAVCPPDPRVAAFLLAEVGGRLVRRGEEVFLAPPPATAGLALLRALGAAHDRWLRINP